MGFARIVHRRIVHPMMGFGTLAALALCGLAACQSGDSGGEPKTGAAAFFDGRSIRWIVPYVPGGGYDEYGRLLAPYLEKYTGARIDIVNLPGAGGMRGVNDLYNSASDGLTIGMINGGAMVTNEISGIQGADYEIAEFVFLGRVVSDPRVLVVSDDSGYASIEEILQSPSQLKIGATGLGGNTYVDAVITKEAFNLPLDVIHGFDSSAVVRQAMLRGDIIGTWGSWGSALDAVGSGRDRVILQSGQERIQDLPDVPTTVELIDRTTDPERTKVILTAWENLHAVGRPVAAPPGTPPDRIEFLSQALFDVLHDPELLADAERSGRPIRYATAEEIRQIVTDATVMPDDIKQLFVRAIRGEL